MRHSLIATAALAALIGFGSAAEAV